MKKVVYLVGVFFTMIMMLSCKSKEERRFDQLFETKQTYSEQGCRVINYSPKREGFYDVDNLPHYAKEDFYLFYEKDGCIFKKEILSKGDPKQVFPFAPNTKYMVFDLSLDNGIEGNLNIGDKTKYSSVQFKESTLSDELFQKQVLLLSGNDFQIFNRIFDDKVIVLDGNNIKVEDDNIIQTYNLTFNDLFYLDYFGLDEDPYNESEFECSDFDYHSSLDNEFEYSYADYPCSLEAAFSCEDLSFIGFTHEKCLSVDKSRFPWELLKEKLGSEASLIDWNQKFIPVSWFNSEKRKIIQECLDEDIDKRVAVAAEEREKEYEEQCRREEEERVDQQTEHIVNNSIDFDDMRNDYKNPIKAKQKYVEGSKMLLTLKAREIRYAENDNYKYVVLGDNMSFIHIYIYTNDEGFASLDYPSVIWIDATFGYRNVDYYGDETYVFRDAKLYLWKEPSFWD